VPPPTMPRRIGFAPFSAICLLPYPVWPPRWRSGQFVSRLLALETQHLAIGGLIGATARKIVEGLFGDPDDVALDQFGAFARTVFGMLESTFPFEHGPALEIVGCHLGKNSREVHLAIADRTEAPCPVHPG